MCPVIMASIAKLRYGQFDLCSCKMHMRFKCAMKFENWVNLQRAPAAAFNAPCLSHDQF